MNKSELIAIAAEKSGMTKKDTERVINAAIDTMVDSMVRREKVQLSGFGTFTVKHRQARMGRNLHTQEAAEIPAAWVPTFTASKALKDHVGKNSL